MFTEGPLGGLDYVGKQDCDGHWTDAAGDGADEARDWSDAVKIDIADSFSATIGRDDAIDADIDDNGPWADHIVRNEGRNTGCGDKHIGRTGDIGKPLGPFVATDDGGLAAHEQDGDWFADMV